MSRGVKNPVTSSNALYPSLQLHEMRLWLLLLNNSSIVRISSFKERRLWRTSQPLFSAGRNGVSGGTETYVRRERNTALSYSTYSKRSLLNQPFRSRGFRFML